MEKLTKKTFYERVFNLDSGKISIDKPVAVKFYYDNCSPCETMAPIFEFLEKELSEFDFFSIKGGSDTKILEKFDIEEMPSFLLFKPNGEFKVISGQMPKGILKRSFESFIEE